ncbi:MAG: Helicase associated domain protein, partial [Lachnospiraceae bacterium]|nr:Helicase associated domain protein [Lachnospiraceae bacterium]
FQLCADNTESRFCFLSPSEHIFKTQQEKWRAAGGDALGNLQFFTYARLMRMEKDELANLRADYIILDEFHRCGAAQWGSGVKQLREMYPKAKILGLSATNIRFLDNQRDMAWELFGGNIASQLTLGDAVAGGILPTPKYVLSIYAYQKELKRYEIRMQQTKNKAVRDAAEKELAALRRALEKADGLADVFARHMQMEEEPKDTKKLQQETADSPAPAKTGQGTKNCGKYIVFCANYDHLCEMQQLAPEWFAKVDSAPHIYTVYSDDPASNREFEAFKADTSRHLKLLYCIDMLNEGIHVDGVDGVILLRPTVSPTIYKQQIGRALAAGKKKSPVIFDIVMNIENLCSIGALEEELQQTATHYRVQGRGGALVGGHFQVIDELGDCRKLFARLTETLGASWETMYAKAQEYYAEHGNLEVPATYVTAEGYSLGAWIATQRKVHAGKVAGCLGEVQVARLDAIGMRWQAMPEAAWERNFAEAKSYYREHGNLSIPKRYITGSGRNLGIWLQRQRTGRRKGLLEKWQVMQLDGIGMVWEMEEPWEVGFRHAKEYFGANGNLEVPNGYICEDEYRLGKWISNQRSAYAAWKRQDSGVEGKEKRDGMAGERKKLSAEKIWKLEEIGMVWNAKAGRPAAGRRG